MRGASTLLALAVAAAGLPAAAGGAAPDLAAYDCTRTDAGPTIAGDKLVAQGFRIASMARFGDINLMLVDPRTSARANCFKRAAPR